MEKEKLIEEISRSLEILKKYANRLKKNPDQVHQLDMELMIEKTRSLYDQLIQLDALAIPFETEIPEPDMPEILEKEQVTGQQPEMSMEIKKPEEVVPEPAHKEVDKELSTEETPVREEPSEKIPDEMSTADNDEIKENVKKDPETGEKSREEDTLKSTIDLFSTAEPTISEVYSEQETISVADKFSQENVNELRGAIGINEKFLFINELFNGDMSKYNKVIDELDEFSTLKGAETYLFELKVQHQWAEENTAYAKLSDLLKRKFGE